MINKLLSRGLCFLLLLSVLAVPVSAKQTRKYYAMPGELYFHLNGCDNLHYLSYSELTVFYSTIEAITHGYEPCKVCDPMNPPSDAAASDKKTTSGTEPTITISQESNNAESQSKENGAASVKMIAWLVGMWFVGGFLYTMFGLQISIMRRCAMKLYSMLQNDTEFWYSGACHKYMKKVIRSNTIILLVLFLLALQFIPLIGAVGFCAGYFMKWLFTKRAAGPSNQNLEETISIFLQFAKPGMEEDFQDALYLAAIKLKNDSIFKYI